MASFMAVKRLNGLQPIDEVGEAAMRKLHLNDVVNVEIKRSRNLAFHRKFFAMLQIILQNQDHYKSMDDLLDVCKLRTGHCRTVQTRQGEVRLPKSISFATMDDTEFADFYDRACAWVVTEVIPGLERQALDEEVAARLQDFGRPEG